MLQQFCPSVIRPFWLVICDSTSIFLLYLYSVGSKQNQNVKT